jgi:hypothetical protein
MKFNRLRRSRLILVAIVSLTTLSMLIIDIQLPKSSASVSSVPESQSLKKSEDSLTSPPLDDEMEPTIGSNPPIVVNGTGDGENISRDGGCEDATGRCSLRAAIQKANAESGSNTIQFSIPFSQPNCDASTSTCFINLSTALPTITGSLTINGPGASALTVRRAPNLGTGFRIFTVTATGTVTFSGLTISRGGTFGAAVPNGSSGGGVLNASTGTVNVTNCILSQNSAGSSSGSGDGGALANTTGRMNITNSTITNNQTLIRSGGGISNVGGVVSIVNSTVSNNSSIANTNSFSLAGGILNSLGIMSITNSTITGNSAAGAGGGIFNGDTLTITNSTIHGNSATEGSANNQGGGIYNNAGTVNIKSSIVAQNTATQGGADVFGSVTSSGFNLVRIRDGSTGFIASTDQTGSLNNPLNPGFDPAGLQNNGGPTQTINLLCSSPAVDKGTSAGLTGTLLTDQRGGTSVRTFDDSSIQNGVGDGTDIGAFERQQSCSTTAQSFAQFNATTYSTPEDCTVVTITVTRAGDTNSTSSVDYFTSNVTATDRKDYNTALGRLPFNPGETSKTFLVLINEDSFVEGTETFNVQLSNPIGMSLGNPSTATITITDDSTESTNPIDDPGLYVCQQYHDFLNRQPDTSGLGFWTNEITSCGSNAQCIETKRINVSAAFFLSIEFQQTGYLVERMNKVAFGNATGNSTFGGAHTLPVPFVRFSDFLSDTQQIGKGVIVGEGNWEQSLESNKQAFAGAFVQRSTFVSALPVTLTPAQFVNQLFVNAGVTPSDTERNAAINEFGGAANTSDIMARARTVRRVADNSLLTQQESNRAFVLAQYFGYTRRNPNDAPDSDYTGYDFWLTKLNQFGGNFVNAEMVKAFITSGEYRNRFGN